MVQEWVLELLAWSVTKNLGLWYIDLVHRFLASWAQDTWQIWAPMHLIWLRICTNMILVACHYLIGAGVGSGAAGLGCDIKSQMLVHRFGT